MTEWSEEAITRLALAAKGGDRAAATEFIRLTQPGLLRFLALLAERGEVEDLAQETYLRAMPALARFDARSTARTWLYAIARRVAVDHVRHAQRRPRTSPLEQLDEAQLSPTPSRFDETVAWQDLLRALDPDRREAFALTQLLGLSYEEAAQVCDCPVGTIRSRVSRARDDLITAARADQDRSPVRSRRARPPRRGVVNGGLGTPRPQAG
jgi:RNA polymerase sigma-70 factor (ECF subfamily)